MTAITFVKSHFQYGRPMATKRGMSPTATFMLTSSTMYLMLFSGQITVLGHALSSAGPTALAEHPARSFG